MRTSLAMGLLALTACGQWDYGLPDAPPARPDVATDACTMSTWYADCDGDGMAALAGQTMMSCALPAPSSCGGSWVTTMPIAGAADCNDTNAAIHPGATEICDSMDNNCNGSTDENGLTTFYLDSDSDGHGNMASSMLTCNAPVGYVAIGDDCDDSNGSIHPGATEICDNVDSNCDGVHDENIMTTFYLDADGDTFGNGSATQQRCSAGGGYVANNTDCNDSNAAVNPNATEVCDSVDNNCAGGIDEGVLITYYRDLDNDGFGKVSSGTTQACSAPGGYSANSTDCNDSANTINPNAAEVCFNGADDNCSGAQDEAAKCSMSCDWAGQRWLSWGYDQSGAQQVGAWANCRNGTLASMTYINTSGQTQPTIPTNGTSTDYVDCNWGVGNRWASQGWDGPTAFSFGAHVHCDGTRVDSMSWGNNALLSGQQPYTDIVGQLACNWNGAIYLSYGWDGFTTSCQFTAGFRVTCNAGHITDFFWVEGNGGCVHTVE